MSVWGKRFCVESYLDPKQPTIQLGNEVEIGECPNGISTVAPLLVSHSMADAFTQISLLTPVDQALHT